MRILVAAKRAFLRDALKTFFHARPGVEIIGMIANKAELLTNVEAESPDLLLLDEDLTEKLVEDVIIPIQQLDYPPMVMVIGYRAETKQAVLDAGAVAFVNKIDPPRTLFTAIEEIRLRGNSV